MGFFSEVQSWFKEDCDYGGRYLQKIILAWEKDDKDGFKKLICSELGIRVPLDYQLVKEYYYQTGRSADLAILHNETPIALIEIKWDDTLGKKTECKQSQLEDYVTYCLQDKDCCLLVLTKNPLANEEHNELGRLNGKGRHLYFGGLAPHLDRSSSSVAKLFFEYLQDKGIVMNDIDTAGLFRFFHRFVNPRNGSGKVTSDEQLINGPEQFSNLLNNVRLIAQDISPDFFDVKGAKRAATVDFSILPAFSQKKLSAQLDEDEKASDEVSLHRKARTGGIFYVYAYERISSDPNPWAEIQYGFSFTMQPNKRHEFKEVSLYAEINGANIEDCYFEKRGAAIIKMLKTGSKKSELVKVFKEQIGEAIRYAIDEKLVDADLRKQLANVLKNSADSLSKCNN